MIALHRGRTPLLAGALLALCPVSDGAGARAANDAWEARGPSVIRPEALRAHVRFLADDLLEGRGTGTRGHEIAARYVAAQLATSGVEPGAGDSYLQPVPLRQARLDAGSTSLSLELRHGRRKLTQGRDFVAFPSLVLEKADVAAEAVYVGYGVRAPEAGHDDFAGVDVRGKVVVCLFGAPAKLSSDERAYYASRSVKDETAAALGAVAQITVIPPEAEKRLSFERIASRGERLAMTWLAPDGSPGPGASGLRARALLSRATAEALMAGAPRSLETLFEEAAHGVVDSFPLEAKVRLHVESRFALLESPNVVGILRGSDPAKAHENVVVSAHLDHLGIGTPREGDSIYNGAYDNATGVAALLEVARALETMPRPRRSVVFLATTAEEKGLLGAEYFVAQPTVPIESIVADLNMDMLLALYPAKDVVAFGDGHSTLGALVHEEAGRVGFSVSPDPFPEENEFTRSDHYAFVKAGVPSLSLQCGLQSADTQRDGSALFQEWMEKTYHSPKDDAAEPMDLDLEARMASLYLAMAYRLAQDEGRPSWTEGDFFAARFAGRGPVRPGP
jgi:Zn-dependent M28 family amino/carboxypeptidase